MKSTSIKERKKTKLEIKEQNLAYKPKNIDQNNKTTSQKSLIGTNKQRIEEVRKELAEVENLKTPEPVKKIQTNDLEKAFYDFSSSRFKNSKIEGLFDDIDEVESFVEPVEIDENFANNQHHQEKLENKSVDIELSLTGNNKTEIVDGVS